MKKHSYGLLVVLLSGLLLGGCAKKEVVKTEEPVVPAAVAAPEAPPKAVPEPLQPAAPPPPAQDKTVVVQEQVVVPEQPQKAVAAETAQKIILETIHFDFDKSDLREPDREILTRNASILLDKLTSNITIAGHCDERGSTEYNLALGERRARSAMKYLVTLGVPDNRLSTISYGEEMPIDSGHDEEAWAKNRRAEFVYSGG